MSVSHLLGSVLAPAVAHDVALLDLDGVVYVGPDAVPGASASLERAAALGLRACYVTNNASRTPDEVAQHLTRLGVPAGTADVVTSAQVAGALLARRLPPGSPVLVVGGHGLRQALRDEGLVPVASVDEAPAAVVQGFAPEVGWRLLAEGTRGVRAGLPWVATNLDATVPTPHGPAPGNGTLVHAVATAAGRPPDEVAGKPGPAAFLEAVRRCASISPLAVGDRLDTDIEGAVAAGVPSMLVLTGIAGAADAIGAAPGRRPTLLGADLAALLVPHPPARSTRQGEATCGDAVVRVRDGGLVPAAAGDDAVDLLRAACAAAWGEVDATGSTVDPRPVLAALGRLDPTAAWVR